MQYKKTELKKNLICLLIQKTPQKIQIIANRILQGVWIQKSI